MATNDDAEQNKGTPAVLSALLLLLVGAAGATDTGHRQLFSKTKGIPVADQVAIYDQLGLKLASDGERFIADDFCENPEASYEVEITDLDGDRSPEVFVIGGNACTSGATGRSIWLFVKSPESGYRSSLGFPAGRWSALPEKSKGFPDLRFVAAGHCEEVWRWNGENYAHSRNIETAKGGCQGR